MDHIEIKHCYTVIELNEYRLECVQFKNEEEAYQYIDRYSDRPMYLIITREKAEIEDYT